MSSGNDAGWPVEGLTRWMAFSRFCGHEDIEEGGYGYAYGDKDEDRDENRGADSWEDRSRRIAVPMLIY